MAAAEEDEERARYALQGELRDMIAGHNLAVVTNAMRIAGLDRLEADTSDEKLTACVYIRAGERSSKPPAITLSGLQELVLIQGEEWCRWPLETMAFADGLERTVFDLLNAAGTDTAERCDASILIAGDEARMQIHEGIVEWNWSEVRQTGHLAPLPNGVALRDPARQFESLHREACRHNLACLVAVMRDVGIDSITASISTAGRPRFTVRAVSSSLASHADAEEAPHLLERSTIPGFVSTISGENGPARRTLPSLRFSQALEHVANQVLYHKYPDWDEMKNGLAEITISEAGAALRIEEEIRQTRRFSAVVPPVPLAADPEPAPNDLPTPD